MHQEKQSLFISKTSCTVLSLSFGYDFDLFGYLDELACLVNNLTVFFDETEHERSLVFIKTSPVVEKMAHVESKLLHRFF